MALPKIISLFSGAWGLDLGCVTAGYSIIFAVGNLEWAIQTHRRNFPDTVSLAADLRALRAEGLKRELELPIEPGERIGVIGGPPC